MQVELFISQLPDVVELSSVVEESRAVRKELEDSTLPAYKNAVNTFNPKELVSVEAKNLQSTFEKLTGGKDSVIDTVAKTLTVLNDNLSKLETYIVKNFKNDIVKANIDVKEISVLQLVGIAGFTSAYARRLLAFFYTSESSSFDNSSIKLNESFSKADIKWLSDKYVDFINALNAFSTKDLEHVLSRLPDIQLNPGNWKTMSSVQSASKVDPLKLQYLNVTNNFIYRFMIKLAEMQADRYKIALEEKRMLEYRHLLLKRQREGKPDARLEKEIVITEDRIARLTYKIRKMEEAND